jgi:type III secretory pathway component EscV
VIDRIRRDPDPFLEWKVRVLFAGGALLAAGMVLGQDVLALLAIAVLVGGMVLMILSANHRRRAQAEAAAQAEGEEEAWGEEAEAADAEETKAGDAGMR